MFPYSKSLKRKIEAGTRSHLECITVPKFNGDKTKFERFWTAFSNKDYESSDIKVLRLKSCLVGKAADTLEGLDYSETAYETAKMRLHRKFGGPRRQVQNQTCAIARQGGGDVREKYRVTLLCLKTVGNELAKNSSRQLRNIQFIRSQGVTVCLI